MIYGNGGIGMGTFQMWLTALLLGAVAQENFVLILVFIVNFPFAVLIQLLTDLFLGSQLSVQTEYTLSNIPSIDFCR